MKKLLAKSNNKYGSCGRTIVEHTQDLLRIYEIIIGPMAINESKKEAIKIACLTHDLGKINSKFQKKIYDVVDKEEVIGVTRVGKEIPHNYLSPSFLLPIIRENTIKGIDESIMVKAVMLHHGKYTDSFKFNFNQIEEAVYYDIGQDILKENKYDIAEIETLINSVVANKFSISSSTLEYNYFHLFNSEVGMNEKQEEFQQQQDFIEIKGFLNLIDHLASEREQEEMKYYLSSKEIEMLDDSLLLYLKEKVGKDKVDFNDIQKSIIKYSSSPVVLTESFTGGGKTICDDRLTSPKKFYLTPNRISAMSFYAESCKKYGKENIGVLHGALHMYKDEEETEMSLSQEQIDLARNYGKPYILATVDQIALSIFKFPNYEKTLVALKNSRVTVDEVHLLSPRMFVAFTILMDYATKNLQTQFHLMTATMPMIYKERLNVINKNNANFKLAINDVPQVETNGMKIEVDYIKNDKIASICVEALKKEQQVLIILNTIDDVISMYERLVKKGIADIQCLHSRFKEDELKDLYAKMTNQNGKIWITTQVVEIALDIDFPIVISDLSPMDSLIQRMGRNNRKGKIEFGQFYILPERENSVYSSDLLKSTKALLASYQKEKKEKKKLSLTMNERKELLESYYGNPRVQKYYKSEFDDAEKDLRKIFGLTSYATLTGDNVMFEFEPYKNIADSKKEAAKFFRKSGMRVKAYLEEDVVSENTKLDGKAITISGNRLYMLKRNNQIEEYKQGKNTLFIVKNNEKSKYDSHFGLKFK